MAKKKKFECPHCPHKSTRKYNMGVHISRWHNGNGLPMPMEQNDSMAYQEANTKLKAHSRHVNRWLDYSGENPRSFPAFDPWRFPWPFPGVNANPKAKDWLDDYIRWVQVTLPLKQVFGNLRPPRREQPITPVPQWDNFDGIIVYRIKACKMCLTVRLTPFFQGQGDVTYETDHRCSQNRITEILHFETDQRKNLSNNIKYIPESLLRICKEWAKDRIYLKAFPTTVDRISATRIDIAKIDKENWLMRTINNPQASVNDAELLEFLQMAKDKTYTYVCIYDSSGTSRDSLYLIAVIRKPI